MKIKEYKAKARRMLLGNYGILIGARFFIGILSYALGFAVVAALLGTISVAISGVAAVTAFSSVMLALLIIAALVALFFFELGSTKLYLNFCRRGEASFTDLFYAFRKGSHPFRYVAVSLLVFFACFIPGLLVWFFAALGIGLLTDSYTAGSLIGYLLMLILIFYLALKFMFAPTIVIDRPGTGAWAAIRRSSRLTKKRKLRLLWLCTFSFFFWSIPILLSFGLASLWIEPYISTTFYLFYLKAEEECFPEESYGEASTEDISGRGGAFTENSASLHDTEPSRSSYEEAVREARIDLRCDADDMIKASHEAAGSESREAEAASEGMALEADDMKPDTEGDKADSEAETGKSSSDTEINISKAADEEEQS